MPVHSKSRFEALGLTETEYAAICEQLGREPSDCELGMYSVQWSEHCSYKCSKAVLSLFSRYKDAIEGAGLENAGVQDIGDGYGIVMKVESHNHPSAVEPYQGAATGVGGIIRDILTMGARPVALLDSLRFGPIDAGPHKARNRYLLEHVVEGIAGYGNCVGVPNVGGETAFDASYSGNPLVNALCVGLVRLDSVTTAAASGTGNPVLYLGSSTGRDGIHGASFASDVLGEDSNANRPNVQIGDPFAEKSLIEATLEALETGAVVAIQDMGAAGLTCSTTEMAAKGGAGMEIDLDHVPMRETDMGAYELLLSESQERMLCVAYKGREGEVIDCYKKWGLHAVVIGQVTTDGNVRCKWHGQTVVDAPAKSFTDGCPAKDLRTAVPKRYASDREFQPDNSAVSHGDALLQMLGSPEHCSKSYVYEQFDQQVQTQTVAAQGMAAAAVLALRGPRQGLALTLTGNSRWVKRDPYVGGQLAVCEAYRNLACVGAKGVCATDGLNFGSPLDPEVYWEFSECVRGIADACEALRTPVLSGNVSFYNQSELGAISPTPMVGMAGVMSSPEAWVGTKITKGDQLCLLGYPTSESSHGLGASSYGELIGGWDAGVPTGPDLNLEVALANLLGELAEQGMLRSARPVGSGGLAVAFAKSCFASESGMSLILNPGILPPVPVQALFGEWPGLVLASVGSLESVRALADERGIMCVGLGEAVFQPTIQVSMDGMTLLEVPYNEAKGRFCTSLQAILSS